MSPPLLHVIGFGSDRLWWHAHPETVLLVAGIMAAYLYTLYVVRPRVSDAGRVKRSQQALFMAGVAVIYIAAASPLHDLSERYLLSAHMFQHLLLSLVAPPLMLAGVPSWVWEAAFSGRRVLPAARVVLHPLVTFSVFNLFILFSHLPEVVDFTLRNHAAHFFAHAGLMTVSLMMWWPVLGNAPQLPRLTYPFQMGYLFVQSLLPAVLAGVFTFSSTPVYEFYAEAPRRWGITVVEDQQMAAGIMKVLGSLILWSFILVAFAKWYVMEEAKEKEPRWDEVEEELEALGIKTRN